MTGFAELHLLRPLWLLALAPAVVLIWLLWRRRGDFAWRRVIAPHLLSQLAAGGGGSRSRPQPVHLLGAFWLVAAIALAGPAWQREPTPFADDRAALVIALHVGPSMLARDVQPTRLERSVHKIRDLLALRPGVRVALVAYAGSAHEVIPFTSDARLIQEFAAELAPDLMPVAGNDLTQAVALAGQMLRRAGLAGTVLLVTDAVPADAVLPGPAAAPVDILAVAAPPGTPPPAEGPPAPALDRAALNAAAQALGGNLVEVSVDDADVRRLARRLDLRPASAALAEGERWRDAGYYLLGPLVFIVLLWFRRGWSVRWDA